jgi:hypothetical protein
MSTENDTTTYYERTESLSPAEAMEEIDDDVLVQLEDTPMAPLVRALRKVAEEGTDD